MERTISATEEIVSFCFAMHQETSDFLYLLQLMAALRINGISVSERKVRRKGNADGAGWCSH